MKKIKLFSLIVLFILTLTNCSKEKEDVDINKEVSIGGVKLGETAMQDSPVVTSEFGVETTWRIKLNNNREVCGFFTRDENR